VTVRQNQKSCWKEIWARIIRKTARGKLGEIRRELADLSGSLDQVRGALHDQDERLHRIESVDPSFFAALEYHFYQDKEAVSLLNRQLSCHPTLWGDAARLHLSPLASVHSCFFNTNSGEIFIDDYTFSGPGVMILAGSHDPNLTGFLRRDAEMTEGFDIRIGKGVWLASGCMILGPCTIGDNAVIAAGAVLAPGTVVPAGSIFGGVPARCIGNLDLASSDSPASAPVMSALGRNGDKLFADGWFPREFHHFPVPAFRLADRKGTVILVGSQWRLWYKWEGPCGGAVVITGSAGTAEFMLPEASGTLDVSLPCGSGKTPEIITVEKRSGEGQLILALDTPVSEEDHHGT